MESNDYLLSLNEQQRAAVEYCDGPQLVIAGAGSGKTRVLTFKILHLLAHDFEPWRILALTFTNKAANEMKDRIRSLVGPGVANQLWMGTFHSIFLKILRRHSERIGFNKDFTIYDSNDSKSLIKSIIKDMQLDDKIYKASSIQNAISMAKNALLSPDAYAMDRDIMEADKRSRRPLIYAIYKTYRERCFASGAMDFDDILYFTNVLLRDNPEIKEHYREFFRYILVDEYQDTNFAQHVIISELCGADARLCVVGDDAQSIYSFRGANIRNILNLKKGYPNLRIFKLEQNFRSTQTIINAANSLIAKNKEQIPKNVFSKNAVGERIEVIQCFSDFEESSIVANRISQLKMKKKCSYEDFAILYRTNAQSRILEESLRKRNIPYRIYSGLSFYQRKEVKDAIAYFRLTVNPNDDEALKRVINYPARGIGDTTLNKLIRASMDNKVSIWQVLNDLDAYDLKINSGTAKKLGVFVDLISSFIKFNGEGNDAYEVSQMIIRDTKLYSMLLTDSTPESISKQENIQELLNGTREFVNMRREEDEDAQISLSDFLSEVSLATDQDESEDSSEERITLMTVHAAKGLEYGNIIVVGVEDDLFPSGMSKSSLQEIEEERRLLYVAITRAKNHCILTYATQRYRNGQTAETSPSPFLRDIDGKFLSLSSGANILSANMMGNNYNTYRSSYHSSTTTSFNQPQSGRRMDSIPTARQSLQRPVTFQSTTPIDTT
ncbi:MAG: UvrD-helicase domain-containing protein, partial [Bacteroidales bacterium]|nr:UvrD-helicase domain-containing protein [Bacteroidales bacterium]